MALRHHGPFPGAKQRVAAGQEERRHGGGGVLRPGRPVGALRREQRVRPRRAPPPRRRRRRHAAFRPLPLRRPAVHRHQAHHRPRRRLQEHGGERDGFLERRQRRRRGEVCRVMGRRVGRRRGFSVRWCRRRLVVEAEGVPELPVQGVGLALRQGATVPQGVGAGARLSMSDVAQERGALAIELDVGGMVITQSISHVLQIRDLTRLLCFDTNYWGRLRDSNIFCIDLSVIRYPIYHIPAHGNLKGISACFLTYHSISSVFQDNIHSGPEDDGGETAALSPFGLATYRMEGDLWRRPGSSDPGRLSDLHWTASSWLKQVGAHHPDFAFFTSQRR